MRGSVIGSSVRLMLSLLAVPLATEAQPAGKVYRLGLLSPATVPAPEVAAIVNLVPGALRELGYVEGENLVIERRFAEGQLDRLHGLAHELVQRRVDVIVAVSNLAIDAAKAATTTIPIVMGFGDGDPVSRGYVASLAHPEGNVTGVTLEAGTMLASKRLELLKAALPQAGRIAVLTTSEPVSHMQVQEAQQAASALGVTLVVVEVQGTDYERAFATMAAARAEALFVLASTTLNRDRMQIIERAARYRLPAMYEWREHVEVGGLMAYGSSVVALSRRVVAQVDKLLKGARPADLPVERPTQFALVINLKTAEALGLTLPPLFLYQADAVIR
jgi:putative tryptophan/tyrosine transport system substrate-binding protein